jgi:hypothetical protein
MAAPVAAVLVFAACRTAPTPGPAQWYLDGVLLPPSTTTDDLGPPRTMTGIEYYSGPTTIPVQYKSTSGAGLCGVVLMWTKDGSERPQS